MNSNTYDNITKIIYYITNIIHRARRRRQVAGHTI